MRFIRIGGQWGFFQSNLESRSPPLGVFFSRGIFRKDSAHGEVLSFALMESCTAKSTRPPQPLRDVSCVVVEDQGLFLEMLGEMLNMRGGLRVHAGALTVAEGKVACQKHKPDLLILDLDLPDGDGLTVAEFLIRLNPSARIIIVSGHISDFVCPVWLNENLQATISKNATFTNLREELDEVIEVKYHGQRRPLAHVQESCLLTPREAEIFALVGEGLCTKEIAACLFLSEHTIKTHRKHIARKLGTTGLEMVQRASARQRAFHLPEAGRP